MRKNIHKKSEARPIKNTPHKTTRKKKSPSQKPKPKIRCTVTQMNFI